MTKKLITLSEHRKICKKLNQVKYRRQRLHIERVKSQLQYVSILKVLMIFKHMLKKRNIIQKRFPCHFVYARLDRALK